jgi:hypothetical protein
LKTEVVWEAGEATFAFSLSPDDPGRKGSASMSGGTMRVRLPHPLAADQVHPDLEALAAVLVATPYTGRHLAVERPISSALAAAVTDSFGFQVEPVDPGAAPRSRPADGLPGLAFSGGADSSAALAILPPDTVSGFMRRIPPLEPSSPLLYRDDAAMHACEMLRAEGRTIHVFETDMEHLRTPLGFPTDWSNAIGLVLMADRLRLRSIAWGVVAESAYRIGHEAFADWAKRRAGWSRLFEAAGLHFDAPVAGVSEVGTATIVSQSSLAGVTQSCIRGGVGTPCGNCWKCFRKSLLDAAITGAWPSDRDLDRLFEVREVDQKLSKLPIPHENVIGWIAGRYRGSHPKMRLLRRRALPPGETFSWLERWYGPAGDLLDDGHRDLVKANLDRRLGRMDRDQEAVFRGWDMTAWLAAAETTAVAERLVGHPVPETPHERAARELAVRQAKIAAAAAARAREADLAGGKGKRLRRGLRGIRRVLRRTRRALTPPS